MFFEKFKYLNIILTVTDLLLTCANVHFSGKVVSILKITVILKILSEFATLLKSLQKCNFFVKIVIARRLKIEIMMAMLFWDMKSLALING